MSLFDKKRSVAALSDNAIDSIKNELNSMLDIAASFDNVMQKSDAICISLEGRMRADLLAFTLYLDGIGKGPTDPAEIKVVNKIFGIDLSHVDFQLYRKDVGNRSFEHAVPPSILMINELGKTVQREQFRTSDGSVAAQGKTSDLSDMLVNGLINLYALIGSAFISADGQIRESESNDLIRYLYMMCHAVNGAGNPWEGVPSVPQQPVDEELRKRG